MKSSHRMLWLPMSSTWTTTATRALRFPRRPPVRMFFRRAPEGSPKRLREGRPKRRSEMSLGWQNGEPDETKSTHAFDFKSTAGGPRKEQKPLPNLAPKASAVRLTPMPPPPKTPKIEKEPTPPSAKEESSPDLPSYEEFAAEQTQLATQLRSRSAEASFDRGGEGEAAAGRGSDAEGSQLEGREAEG